MVSTARTLVRNPLGRGRGGVARGVRWTVVCRGGDSNRCVGMTGGQACLRAVQHQRQGDDHERRDLPESTHAGLG